MTSPAWQKWRAVERRLSAGASLVIDGGMGTEVEKIAGREALNPNGWTSSMNLTHPQAVKQAHRRFLDAGADVIISNTYATNRHILAGAGLEAKTAENNITAVRLAREAIAEWRMAGGVGDPIVAGSISIHAPGNEKEKLKGGSPWPTREVEVANYLEQAQLLMKAGVDLLFVELVWNMEHGRNVLEAMKSIVDIPIFVGVTVFNEAICVESHDIRVGPLKIGQFDKRVATAQSPDAVPLRLAIAEFVANPSIVGVNVMHTKADLALRCLLAIREGGWNGPLGVYPDCAEWLRDGFGAVTLSPDAFVEYAKKWRSSAKAQLIGGCCGAGPEHIQALSKWARQPASRM